MIEQYNSTILYSLQHILKYDFGIRNTTVKDTVKIRKLKQINWENTVIPQQQ